ncbi:MAG: hypothetical protein QXD48_03715 [Candidatus Aenigmatarchaeota archaeon]
MRFLPIVVLSIPLYLNAQNFHIKGPGVAARSLGGAFIALAEDPTAVFWNPAGVAQKRGYEVYISRVYESYQITSNIKDFYTNAYNSNHPKDLFIGFKIPLFKINNINLIGSFSFYELIDFYHSYKTTEFSEAQLGGINSITINFAYPYSDNLFLGMNYNLLFGERFLKFRDFSEESFGGNKDEKYDYWSPISLGIGLLYKYKNDFRIGIKIASPGILTEKSHSYRATINMPWIIGFGVAYNFSNDLIYSADLGWCECRKFVREFKKPFEYYQEGDKQQIGYKNTFQTRLGAQYFFKISRLRIPIRVGVGTDPKMYIDGENKQISGAFFSVGVGFEFDSFSIDFGFEFNRTPYKIKGQGGYNENFELYMLSIKLKKASF